MAFEDLHNTEKNNNNLDQLQKAVDIIKKEGFIGRSSSFLRDHNITIDKHDSTFKKLSSYKKVISNKSRYSYYTSYLGRCKKNGSIYQIYSVYCRFKKLYVSPRRKRR